MKNDTNMAKLRLLLVMVIFGSLGVFVRHVTVSSGFIAMVRSVVGVLFLAAVLLARRSHPDWAAIRGNRNWLWLSLSGAALGFNWVLLFEAYNYISVAQATICYYMGAVFVILVSPLLLGEKLTLKKLTCAAVAVVGVILVSGVGESAAADFRGLILALGAAVLYASIVIINKRVEGVSSFDCTLVQLAASTVVMVGYVCIIGWEPASAFTGTTGVLLLILGVVHTGVAYMLYFDCLPKVPAQTVALFSYIDPVVAILLSGLMLHEPLTITSLLGGVMVIGAAMAANLME